MRKIGLCTLGLIAGLVPLRADWKISTVYIYDGQRSTHTEYFKGGMQRSDVELAQPSGNRMVMVVDHDRLRQITWNVDAREYSLVALNPTPPVADKAIESETARPELRIEISTTDTGDRQSMFGRTARHLISHEKRYMTELGSAPVLQSESETDGWYVDVPGLPSAKSGYGFTYLALSGREPIVKVNHTGPALTGLPVLVNATARSFLSNGARTRTLHSSARVTELFEGTLSPQLFEPPSGFQRVSRVQSGPISTSTDYLQMFWQGLEDWLAGLFS